MWLLPQPSSATRGCRSWPSGVCSPSSCSLAFRRMQCCWEPLLFLPALDTLKLYIADDRGTGSGGCSCAATRVATRAAGSPCLVSETRAGWPSQRLSQRRPRPCSTPRFRSLRRSLATSVSHSEAAVAIPRAAVLRACGEQDGRGSGTESVPDCEQSMSQSEVLGGRRRWGGQLWRAPCCAHECAWMHLHA